MNIPELLTTTTDLLHDRAGRDWLQGLPTTVTEAREAWRLGDVSPRPVGHRLLARTSGFNHRSLLEVHADDRWWQSAAVARAWALEGLGPAVLAISPQLRAHLVAEPVASSNHSSPKAAEASRMVGHHLHRAHHAELLTCDGDRRELPAVAERAHEAAALQRALLDGGHDVGFDPSLLERDAKVLAELDGDALLHGALGDGGVWVSGSTQSNHVLLTGARPCLGPAEYDLATWVTVPRRSASGRELLAAITDGYEQAGGSLDAALLARLVALHARFELAWAALSGVDRPRSVDGPTPTERTACLTRLAGDESSSER